MEIKADLDVLNLSQHAEDTLSALNKAQIRVSSRFTSYHLARAIEHQQGVVAALKDAANSIRRIPPSTQNSHASHTS